MQEVYKAIEKHLKTDKGMIEGVDRMEELAKTLAKQVEITKDLTSVIDGLESNAANDARLDALRKWNEYIRIEELPLETANDALIGELYRIIYTTEKRAL